MIFKKQSQFCISLIMVFILLAFVGGASAAMNDLSNHWAKDEINNLLTKGVLSGYPDQTFRPDQPMSRAEFITLVNKAFGFKGNKTISFPDVTRQDWFYVQVEAAENADYIQGFEDGYFRPYKQISRQEAVVILYRILKLGSSNIDNINTLSDKNQIPDWSKNAISALIREGYIKGYPDNTFRPAISISRAEAAIILNKVMNKTANVQETKPPEPLTPSQSIAFSELGTRPLFISLGEMNSVTMQIEDISNAAKRFGLKTEDLLSGKEKLAINVDNKIIEFEVLTIKEIGVTVLQASWISTAVTSEQDATNLKIYRK